MTDHDWDTPGMERSKRADGPGSGAVGGGAGPAVFGHPLADLGDELDKLLAKAAAAPAWTMSAAQVQAVLPRLTRARAALAGIELKVAAHADTVGLAEHAAAANTVGWWANNTRQTRPATHRLLKLAHALDLRHRKVGEALESGRILLDQAQVIVDGIDALPADLVNEQLRGEAEDRLLELAADHDARELKRLADRILEVLAPEVAEEHERRVLEEQERRARETARLTMSDDGHGSCFGRFKVPTAVGAMLRKHIMALAAPRHRSSLGPDDHDAADAPPSGPGDRTPDGRVAQPLRWGQAFIDYIETKGEAPVPKAGGVAATVVITMSLESLLGAETAATLDTGDRISASEARRLACGAGIIPAVLGGPSQVLDVGRRARFHTEPQRIAMMLRDGGCAAEGCDWPPGMCHAHHDATSWGDGGGTSVANGRLLCPRHHAMAHDTRYQHKTSPNGKVCFSRRT